MIMRKGFFIVVEGLDGAGKSTQVSKITEELKSKGLEVRYLHFPRYDSPVFGQLISMFLRGDLGTIDNVDPHLVALIYAGDRADAAKTVREWLDLGYAVIVDRYVYSNIAYQCAKIADPSRKEELREWIFSLEYDYYGIPKPDLSIFLDVPFSFTVDRLTSARQGDDRDYLGGKSDIHEASLPFQQLVREEYLKAVDRDSDFVKVDCSLDGNMAPADTIYSRIAEVLHEKI